MIFNLFVDFESKIWTTSLRIRSVIKSHKFFNKYCSFHFVRHYLSTRYGEFVDSIVHVVLRIPYNRFGYQVLKKRNYKISVFLFLPSVSVFQPLQ